VGRYAERQVVKDGLRSCQQTWITSGVMGMNEEEASRQHSSFAEMPE